MKLGSGEGRGERLEMLITGRTLSSAVSLLPLCILP